MKQINQPVLLGKKISLRPITVDDTALIVKWRNNPEVKKWLISQEHVTEDMHRHWLETKVATKAVIQYIIEDIVEKKPVGSVYFHNIDEKHNNAEYGIFIGDNNARGKGFGTEAARLFLAYGFNVLKFHRISLQVFKGNQAAYKSYKYAGFSYEGCCRDMVCIAGKYYDIILMAVLSTDFCQLLN